jgi:hypothetical protein
MSTCVYVCPSSEPEVDISFVTAHTFFENSLTDFDVLPSISRRWIKNLSAGDDAIHLSLADASLVLLYLQVDMSYMTS